MTEKQEAEHLIKSFLPYVVGADRYSHNVDSMNVFIAKELAVASVIYAYHLKVNAYRELEEFCLDVATQAAFYADKRMNQVIQEIQNYEQKK